MQVDVSAVLSAIAIIVSGAVAIWLATAKYAISNRDAEINRRIVELATLTNNSHAALLITVTSIDARLHTEEKATIRQDGDLALVQHQHDGLNEAVAEIKRLMVTKSEFVALDRMVRDRLDELLGRRQPGYVPRPTPGHYRGIGEGTSPSSPVPPYKKEK